jgi:hypothetical protein
MDRHDSVGADIAMIALHTLTADELARLNEGGFTRAGGDVTCLCGKRYGCHPTPIEGVTGRRWGWLRRLCDGRFIKL